MNRSGSLLYKDERKVLFAIFITLIIGISFGGVMWHLAGVYSPYSYLPVRVDSLNKFSSYEELNTFLETNLIENNCFFYPTRGGLMLTDRLSIAEMSGISESLSSEFSGTNIQVPGVDEADLVKTDGEYLYLALKNTIVIMKAYPAEEATVLSTFELKERIAGIFINGDKIALFAVTESYYINRWERIVLPYQTTIQVYDVSNKTSPTLERSITIDGYYFNSRMIGDYIYVLINHSACLDNGEVDLPTIRSDKITVDIEAHTIYYSNSSDASYAFTNIVAINMQDPKEAFSHETFLIATACNLYVSSSHIYIVSPRCLEIDSELLSGSIVHKISIQSSEINYLADGFIPGWILDQFSMDEFKGFFRIATTSGYAARSNLSLMNNIYVLDGTMRIVGRIENIAPGEDLHSARFIGEKCYLVTFKKVDPLFIIDVADPKNPRILGKLKIPGYSDYLHPYDETHLIGVGKETVEADRGDFAWYQGLKISIFDVGEVSKPKELVKYEIGDRGTDSLVLCDHKAFLFSKSNHLLVLPILVAEINPDTYHGKVPPDAYGEYVFQGAYVFHVSLDDGILVRGKITHLENDELMKSGYSFASKYSVRRALYIDNVLYTISEKMIKMNDLGNLNEINAIVYNDN